LKRVVVGSVGVLAVVVMVAAATAVGKVPQPKPVECLKDSGREQCLAYTLIHVEYSEPPHGAGPGSTFPITITGRIKSPGDHDLCLARRRIKVKLAWEIANGYPETAGGGFKKKVKTNRSGEFSVTIVGTAPAGSLAVLAVAHPQRENRHFKGRQITCLEDIAPREGTYWDYTPVTGWAFGGGEFHG
jgi:hypothetical protein